MKLLPLGSLLFGLALMVTGTCYAQACPTASALPRLSFQALDELDLSACDAHQLILLMGAAQSMIEDTLEDNQIRADISFSKVADELQIRGKEEDFDPESPPVAFLLQELEKQQYFLALNQPSDWAKLWHYLQEGRYGYVAKRFVDRGLLPWLVVGMIGLGLSLFWFLRKRKLKSSTG